MAAENKVIGGDYVKYSVDVIFGKVTLNRGFKQIALDKKNVEEIQLLEADYKTSASSAITRGALGAFVLGPVGALAALSAKKKGVHTVAVLFKNEKKSLLEVDDKIYKAILKKLY